jgi:AraC family transcriptional regulator, transcriptional activator of pobA
VPPEPPISLLDFRRPDETEVPFEIGRLETTHPIQITEPHRHTFYEIIWVIDGAGVHAADFEERAIEPQTVFLLSPGQIHAMHVDRPLCGYKLVFTADFFVLDGRAADAAADLPFFRVGIANPVLALADEEAAHLRAIAEDLLAEFDARAAWRREMLRARFQTLLLTLGRAAQRQQVRVPPVTSTVARFQALLEEHFRQLHLVADYARLLALTPGHLNHLAKAATGQTASALIDARLVLEAKRLLAHSDATVDQMARDLGFRDASYFGRHFRRHVGQPPGAFRATIHEKYRNDH